MNATQLPEDAEQHTGAVLKTSSSVPVVDKELTHRSAGSPSSAGKGDVGEWPTEDHDEVDPTKPGKRRLFGLGKKKAEDGTLQEIEDTGEKPDSGDAEETRSQWPHAATATAVSTDTEHTASVPQSAPLEASQTNSASPAPRSTHPYHHHPSSPNRNLFSSSPRLPSPASSQIFERDVQESTLPAPTSPAIPGHIQTENHIPPVLEASSLAITDDHLDPDSVEIVMHSAHQPAAVTVTGAGSSEAVGNAWSDELIAHPDVDDAASNYGALDAADVRRLSFISFADVVQAEHAEHSNNRDSVHLPGGPSAASHWANRSPSPVRSLLSSPAFGTSPPTSGAGSLPGLDNSPVRGGKGPNSPSSAYSPPLGGELTIETMRQALRKTGSGDLSGARSQPLSAISGEEGASDHSWR